MHRFFVPPHWVQGNVVTLEGEVAYQVRRVLRLKPGDSIVLLDNTGWEYLVSLTSFQGDKAYGALVKKVPSAGEAEVDLVLFQGVLKGDKLEWVFQKGTELGLKAFVPLFCRRSLPRATEEWARSKYPRWRRIIQEAAEQCRRGRLPALHPPLSFPEACSRVQGLSLIPWEGEEARSLKQVLEGLSEAKPSVINLFIGPEGGFTPEEVTQAQERGIVPVTLGRRILRAETAALVAASAILYHLGELEGGGGSSLQTAGRRRLEG